MTSKLNLGLKSNSEAIQAFLQNEKGSVLVYEAGQLKVALIGKEMTPEQAHLSSLNAFFSYSIAHPDELHHLDLNTLHYFQKHLVYVEKMVSVSTFKVESLFHKVIDLAHVQEKMGDALAKKTPTEFVQFLQEKKYELKDFDESFIKQALINFFKDPNLSHDNFVLLINALSNLRKVDFSQIYDKNLFDHILTSFKRFSNQMTVIEARSFLYLVSSKIPEIHIMLNDNSIQIEEKDRIALNALFGNFFGQADDNTNVKNILQNLMFSHVTYLPNQSKEHLLILFDLMPEKITYSEFTDLVSQLKDPQILDRMLQIPYFKQKILDTPSDFFTALAQNSENFADVLAKHQLNSPTIFSYLNSGVIATAIVRKNINFFKIFGDVKIPKDVWNVVFSEVKRESMSLEVVQFWQKHSKLFEDPKKFLKIDQKVSFPDRTEFNYLQMRWAKLGSGMFKGVELMVQLLEKRSDASAIYETKFADGEHFSKIFGELNCSLATYTKMIDLIGVENFFKPSFLQGFLGGCFDQTEKTNKIILLQQLCEIYPVAKPIITSYLTDGDNPPYITFLEKASKGYRSMLVSQSIDVFNYFGLDFSVPFFLGTSDEGNLLHLLCKNSHETLNLPKDLIISLASQRNGVNKTPIQVALESNNVSAVLNFLQLGLIKNSDIEVTKFCKEMFKRLSKNQVTSIAKAQFLFLFNELLDKDFIIKFINQLDPVKDKLPAEFLTIVLNHTTFNSLTIQEKSEVYSNVLKFISFGNVNFFNKLFDGLSSSQFEAIAHYVFNSKNEILIEKFLFLKRHIDLSLKDSEGSSLMEVCLKNKVGLQSVFSFGLIHQKEFVMEFMRDNLDKLPVDTVTFFVNTLGQQDLATFILSLNSSSQKSMILKILPQLNNQAIDRIINVLSNDWFELEGALHLLISLGRVQVFDRLNLEGFDLKLKVSDQSILDVAVANLQHFDMLKKVLSLGVFSGQEIETALQKVNYFDTFKLLELNIPNKELILKNKLENFVTEIESYGLNNPILKRLKSDLKLLIQSKSFLTDAATFAQQNTFDGTFSYAKYVQNKFKMDLKHLGIKPTSVNIPQADTKIDINRFMELFEAVIPSTHTGVDDKGEVYSRDKLKELLLSMIDRVNKKSGGVAVPNDPVERDEFYGHLSNLYRNIITALSQESDHEKIISALTDIAVGATHCGERWIKEATDHFLILSGQSTSTSFEESGYQTLWNLRTGVLEQMLHEFELGLHTESYIIDLLKIHRQAEFLMKGNPSRVFVPNRITDEMILRSFDAKYNNALVYNCLNNWLNDPLLPTSERLKTEMWLADIIPLSPKDQERLDQKELEIVQVVQRAMPIEVKLDFVPRTLQSAFKELSVDFNRDGHELSEEFFWQGLAVQEQFKQDPSLIEPFIDKMLSIESAPPQQQQNLKSLKADLIEAFKNPVTQLKILEMIRHGTNVSMLTFFSKSLNPELFEDLRVKEGLLESMIDSKIESRWKSMNENQIIDLLKNRPDLNEKLVDWFIAQLRPQVQDKFALSSFGPKLKDQFLKDPDLAIRLVQFIASGEKDFNKLFGSVRDIEGEVREYAKLLSGQGYDISDPSIIRDWLTKEHKVNLSPNDMENWKNYGVKSPERLKEILQDAITNEKRNLLMGRIYQTDSDGVVAPFDAQGRRLTPEQVQTTKVYKLFRPEIIAIVAGRLLGL